jgi:hypothetical protein
MDFKRILIGLLRGFAIKQDMPGEIWQSLVKRPMKLEAQ